jgi:hypothetical protein
MIIGRYHIGDTASFSQPAKATWILATEVALAFAYASRKASTYKAIV